MVNVSRAEAGGWEARLGGEKLIIPGETRRQRRRLPRFALLFAFLLASITLYPYSESSGFGFYAFRILTAGAVLLTVWAVTFSRGLLVLVALLAVPSVLQHVLFHPQAQGAVPLINRLLSIAFDLLIIGIISVHIFRTREPTSDTIFGALCIYLLIGFVFASVYSTITVRQPAAFYLAPEVNVHAVPDRFDFVTFSFSTLTEMGSPHMTPVAPIARSVTLLESIVGVLYLAVLISRLISAYRSEEAHKETAR